jgi:nicotinate-nucleotide adenylyltransferase
VFGQLRIGIYGGAFNPPHRGHAIGAIRAVEQLRLDKLLVIPSGVSPHKPMPDGTPSAASRLDMARIAFRDVPNAEVSDIEIRRPGESYTADTVREIERVYPDSEMFLIVGTDMYLTLERWYDAEYLLSRATPAVTLRYTDALERIEAASVSLERRGVRTEIVRNGAIEISSSALREKFAHRGGAEFVDDEVYRFILRERLYGVKPDFDRLRRYAYAMLDVKRIRHVAGCEEEAVALAKRWGVSVDDARTAAILHDVTKRLTLEEQLELCEIYGIVLDELERESDKLLHSKTAAALSKREFSVNSGVSDAILWHTTGKADMSPLEKIIYLADYIEPNRDFTGVEAMRRLAYEDLDAALLLGLRSSLAELLEKGKIPHPNTLGAIASLERDT